MEKTLSWRKNIFDSHYQVAENMLLSCSLSFNLLQNSAMATTRKDIFQLKSEGFNPETKIFNQKQEVIAVIRYDWLNLKAKLMLSSGDAFDWSFQNSWLSRWSLDNHRDKHVIYDAQTGSGLIRSNTDDELIIISGLFIKEYYYRILIAFVILVGVISTGRSIF